MPFVSGFLRVTSHGHPDQGLPETPVDPGFGGERPSLPDPGFGIPAPPPGVWPPPSSTLPIVPAPPNTPPGAIWPPQPPPVIWPRPPGGGGGRPDQGLPPSSGEHPDNVLPGQTPETKPPSEPKTYWLVAGIPGIGWRYIAVDPSLRPDNTLPPVPGTPDQGLPPTTPPAEPKPA